MDDLIQMEKDLLAHLGFAKRADDGNSYPEGNYRDVAKKYGIIELGHEHEERLEKDYGEVFLLKNFPLYISPFWNMK